MYRELNYIRLIKFIEYDDTKSIIGKINIVSLEHMDKDDLLYIFPLIERIIIEIYKLVPGAIVENNNQGIR